MLPLEEELVAIRRPHRFHLGSKGVSAVSHCNKTLENRAVAAPSEEFLAVQRRSLLPGSRRGRGAVAVTRAVVFRQRPLIRKPAAMTGTCREAVTRAVVSRQRRLFWQPAAVIGACRETLAEAARRCLVRQNRLAAAVLRGRSCARLNRLPAGGAVRIACGRVAPEHWSAVVSRAIAVRLVLTCRLMCFVRRPTLTLKACKQGRTSIK